jgi:hypothetical protein
MKITINLLSQEWLNCIHAPEGLKGTLRNVLWSNGWRDGVVITMAGSGSIITYTW